MQGGYDNYHSFLPSFSRPSFHSFSIPCDGEIQLFLIKDNLASLRRHYPAKNIQKKKFSHRIDKQKS